MKKFLALTFDLEIFPWLRKRNFEKALKNSKIGFLNLVEWIESLKGSFTFFVNGEFANRWPKIFDLITSNVEIASHGFSHPFKFYSLKKVKGDVEKITRLLNSYGIEPKGYRFPNMQ
ncbi:MAG: polysaccharide deacetylase family protein, partial [Candidatus Aenigmarchaeota archaeon]|nr:polysaccharide deacetylase family protein [Candidatus Aenigmarchaeota archaeon]